MNPFQHFELVWERCNHLTVIQAYLSTQVSTILPLDDLLRAEWVARVSALDLFVHEVVAQRMLAIFEGRFPATPAYLKFHISNETVERIRLAKNNVDASAAYDLEIRNQLSFIAYQDPEKIAEGIRLCSTVELWNEIALKLGATNSDKNEQAKKLKKDLSLIIQRRNKIAHEGDLQPGLPRELWPVSSGDVAYVKQKIEAIVTAIKDLVTV